MTLDVVGPSRSADRRLALRRPEGVAAALTAFAPVVGLAAAQGGFFPGAWGWATFPLLWLAALALVLRDRIRLSGPEKVLLGLLFALTVWILLSATWSVAPAASILESQRGLLYVAGVAAALLVSRSRDVPRLLGGLLAAICAIAAFSLATRLLPDRVGVFDATSVYRLAQPIGYWNGLAIFMGMGALVALAFASRARSLVVRAVCAGALVLLLLTFYFTFGRGAWIALAAGVFTAVAVDPRRLQLLASMLVLSPAPAVAVWVASREAGLTHAGAAYGRAVHDGHRLALVLLLLAAANAVLAVAFASVERRFEPAAWARQAFAVAIALVVVAGLAGVLVRYGGPTTLAHKGYRAFNAPPPHVQSNLNKRLLSFSGNGRADLWRVAWDDARNHAVLGAGAGTYERYFLAHQPSAVSRVRDAHGLYIETLAELGPIGLILLLGALVGPVDGSGAGAQASARSGSGRRVRGISRSHGRRLGLGAARGHSRRAPLRRGHSRRSAALVSLASALGSGSMDRCRRHRRRCRLCSGRSRGQHGSEPEQRCPAETRLGGSGRRRSARRDVDALVAEALGGSRPCAVRSGSAFSREGELPKSHLDRFRRLGALVPPGQRERGGRKATRTPPGRSSLPSSAALARQCQHRSEAVRDSTAPPVTPRVG